MINEMEKKFSAIFLYPSNEENNSNENKNSNGNTGDARYNNQHDNNKTQQ